MKHFNSNIPSIFVRACVRSCGLPIASKIHFQNNNHEYDLTNKTMSFTTVPFFKEHLQQQIEFAGGTVYNHFEDIPKNKHRTCVLLAPYPCLTAAYIQCLASNIPVSTLFISILALYWPAPSCH